MPMRSVSAGCVSGCSTYSSEFSVTRGSNKPGWGCSSTPPSTQRPQPWRQPSNVYMWMFLLGSSLDACSLCPFIRLDIQSPKPRNHNAKERFHTLTQLEHQFPVKMTVTRRDESHKDESDIRYKCFTKPNCCGNIVAWTAHRPSRTYMPQRQSSGWDILTNFQVQLMLNNRASQQTHLVANDASRVREVLALPVPSRFDKVAILLGIGWCWEAHPILNAETHRSSGTTWQSRSGLRRWQLASAIALQSLPLRKGCCGPLPLAKRHGSLLCNFG